VIHSFYNLKIIVASYDTKIEQCDQLIRFNGKRSVSANLKIETKKRKVVEQIFTCFDDYRKNVVNSRIEQRLYSEAFENLEKHYMEKYSAYQNFSAELFTLRINAIKKKYDELGLIEFGKLNTQDIYKVIEQAKALEDVARKLLEQMNTFICSSEKLQPLSTIDLYYNMANYFHECNCISTKNKHELLGRLRPELTKALTNFNFTLAKELLSKIKELS
jgi:hypothetical protein